MTVLIGGILARSEHHFGRTRQGSAEGRKRKPLDHIARSTWLRMTWCSMRTPPRWSNMSLSPELFCEKRQTSCSIRLAVTPFRSSWPGMPIECGISMKDRRFTKGGPSRNNRRQRAGPLYRQFYMWAARPDGSELMDSTDLKCMFQKIYNEIFIISPDAVAMSKSQ